MVSNYLCKHLILGCILILLVMYTVNSGNKKSRAKYSRLPQQGKTDSASTGITEHGSMGHESSGITEHVSVGPESSGITEHQSRMFFVTKYFNEILF
uniref:Uncharacterized protein n=1 Tax=Meloidogyne hapla TaxID=6305 RepID=A0A1I8BI93_MELHA